MKKTLLLIGSGLLLLGGCRVYEDEAATKKIAGIAARNAEDREKARSKGDAILSRVNAEQDDRIARIDGYLARRADEPPRKLERNRARINDLRQDARDMASTRDHSITDIEASMVVSGTVSKIEGDTVHLKTDDGRDLSLRAATNSHVSVSNREIPAFSLPIGYPVTATYGSADGENYYFEVRAEADQ